MATVWAQENLPVTFMYVAHRNTSGLTDVTYEVVDLGNDTILTAASIMTESAAASGTYLKEYNFPAAGNYKVTMNSASLPSPKIELYVVSAAYVPPTPPTPTPTEEGDTWSVTRSLDAGEAVQFPNSPDLTGRVQTVQLETNNRLTALIENSTDEGATWDHVGEKYTIDNMTDKRSTYADGMIRVTCTSDEASEGQAITLTIVSKFVDHRWVTPEDVWRTAGISADVIPRGDVAWMIDRAIGSVKDMTGREYEVGGAQVTETYAGDDSNTLMVDHYPIITLSSLTIDGTSVTPSYVDIWADEGKFLLTTNAEETSFKSSTTGERLISVTYTHGVVDSSSEIPAHIKRLTECIAAIMALTHQTGGTYDDITSYTVGGYSAGVGEPYMNIKATVDYLQKEITKLMSNIRKQVFMA